ncbi:MAG: TetR/AcrR family transcriptional regulator [Trebonia sp.]|jgi:AcrR family transcriptional regulator
MTAALNAPGGRANQKARTRAAILESCGELVRSGAEVSMPEVAARAMVSEATAYRYFPDLISLLQEALAGLWPTAERALAPVADSRDPVERVTFACQYLLRGVHAYQGGVRAMISHTITAPAEARTRPGIRFGLIDYALAPFAAPGSPGGLVPSAMTRLKQDLAVVVSAEAFFVLTDLCGLAPDDAIGSATRTAATLTRVAFGD